MTRIDKASAPVAVVNTAAYERNLRTISQLCQGTKLMAVVKADAYGHGLLPIAQAAERAGANLLGVLDIETGLELRSQGIRTPQFAWLHSPQSDFAKAIDANIELSASTIDELNRIADAGFAKVHLKIDTGLNRNGATVEEWPELIELAERLQSDGRIQVVAIWSHLADAGNAADQQAIEVFEWAWNLAQQRSVGKYRHLASSPSAFALPSVRYELVRIGISAFGVSPVEGSNRDELQLEAVMTLAAEVSAVAQDRATLAIGYQHGVFSALTGLAGKNYKVIEVGATSTEVQPSKPVQVGDTFELFGTHTDIQEWADHLATVPDELFAALWAMPKRYISN